MYKYGDNDDQVDDVALFRPSTQTWYYDYNHDGVTDTQVAGWGQKGDLPLAGDFDSDSRIDDVAVFRTSSVSLKNVLRTAFDAALK